MLPNAPRDPQDSSARPILFHFCGPIRAETERVRVRIRVTFPVDHSSGKYPMTTTTVQWRWLVYDEVLKKKIITRHHMTEEEARERYGPDAEKVEWSRMEIKNFGSPGDFMNKRDDGGGT